MSGPKDWPEGWSRGGERPGGGPTRRPSSGSSEPERTQVIPTPGDGRRSSGDREQELWRSRLEEPRGRRDSGRRDAPPPTRPREPAPPPLRREPRRGGRGRTAKRVLLALLLIFALLVGMFLYFFSRIEKVDALQDYDGRPEASPGQDWLIVGSDSREGLSDEEIKELRLGKIGGKRTDTIILLHKPTSGAPTLVSLPRDSYVPIPGHGRNKLNAAYAFGGPALLARTVEQVTGIRIDHYTEIGFGGFVGMTDAVGGVELCPKRRIKDQKSGLDVQKGCQDMDGPTALAYVRARYFDPKGDLGRVERQQEFLGAVFDQASSPATLLNPFRLVSLGNAATTSLTIDEGDGPISLLQFALAMRAVAGGGGTRTTVPVADPNFQSDAGSAVRWDREKALELFRSLREN